MSGYSCAYCGNKLGGIFYTLGGGKVAHEKCYLMARPPVSKATFEEVLQSGNLHTLKEVLKVALSVPTQDLIVAAYNESARRLYNHRLEMADGT